tara:strand:- start:284 stop:502 length:219 start_codon:yes stop_codon:yes gene_type:complete
MKTQYKVINRKTKKQQILNAKQVAKFFKYQNIRDYGITVVRQKQILKNIIAFIIVSICTIGLLMLGAMMDRL